MRWIAAFFLAFVSSQASAIEPPDWAFLVMDKVQPPAAPDDGQPKQMPGSSRSFTLKQLSDPANAPDWYPDEHPPMPKIVANGAPQVRACGTCHTVMGYGRAENANLAGLSREYFIQQMEDYKTGKRLGNANMTNFAKAMSAEDLEAAAVYFASIKAVPWIRLVETDTVPQSYVGRGNMRQVLPGGTDEPIGRRIIEVPEDGMRAEARDPRSANIAYVPTGSVAKGERLALQGGDKTVACTGCHGPDLRGLATAPPIAGRSPVYIVRQLIMMQNGQRTSEQSRLMMSAVEKLDLDDMIAIAAYTAAQKP